MMKPNSFTILIDKFQNEFFSFLHYLFLSQKKFFILGEIVRAFQTYKEKAALNNGEFEELILHIQEIFELENNFYIDVRAQTGCSEFYRVYMEEHIVEPISIREYLFGKEKYVNPKSSEDILNLNFKPFYEKNPSVRDVNNIGAGVEYLNKYLSSRMFNDINKWRTVLFEFIKLHKHKTQQLILNDRLSDPDDLNAAIDKALKTLNGSDENTPYAEIKHTLQNFGFEPGLGKDAGEISDSLRLIKNLLNSPDHISLGQFLSKIPMIFNIVVISPHGYFAQENVLGLPDTGGQVVYILDQVKALEKYLAASLKRAGLNIVPKIIILTRQIPNAGNTKCGQRLEKVYTTKNVWILRVPFRTHNAAITNNWISRFEIWPYLEEFAEDSYVALKAEFNGKPDLIIGNYSDGNLVSYLLSKKFGVTNCCIAHALEKSKYLFSDLYWNQLEDQYNFSIQFTADLIAMNSSDFQITSTYQEIAGTEYTVGQYETHKHFTLPGLYRVENGTNLYHTKYNIIPPGVNERIFFPYYQHDKRIQETKTILNELLFGNVEDSEVFGKLEKPELTPIFSMARLDSNKNLSSLVKWFGESEELQKQCSLIIVGGKINAAQSSDKEEIDQIKLIHGFIEKYNLTNKIRWIGKLFRKDEAGEVYRVIADRKGIFVQPGLFEGFGLTVLEAMNSGLPVIATKYGGPLEIIQNGKNGYHIDPINSSESTRVIADVINNINTEKDFWDTLSKNSVKRVQEKYNWKLHSEKLLSLSKIYGFWKYSTNIDSAGTEAYLDIIYHLLYKPRANRLLLKHNTVNE